MVKNNKCKRAGGGPLVAILVSIHRKKSIFKIGQRLLLINVMHIWNLEEKG